LHIYLKIGFVNCAGHKAVRAYVRDRCVRFNVDRFHCDVPAPRSVYRHSKPKSLF